MNDTVARVRFTLSQCMAVMVVLAAFCTLSVPGYVASTRTPNERTTSAAVGSLATAEADFRSNDRDGNGIADFWTRDINGLYSLLGVDGQPIRLIESDVAAADVTGCAPMSGMAPRDGEWKPRAGHVIRAMATYEEREITSYGERNEGKFAFLGLPVTYVAGRQLFMMDESLTIFRGDPGSSYDTQYVGGWSPAALFRWVGARIGGNEFTPASPVPSAPGGMGWSKID